MARLPGGNPDLATLQRSVFSTLVSRLKAFEGPTFPLHVGDTYMPPPDGAWIEQQTLVEEPGLHRYEIPKGRAELLQAIVDRRNRLTPQNPITRERVLITIGATGGLSAAVRALLVPGQTILLLAPYWPLIRGMSVSHGVKTVEIPFYDRVDSPEVAKELIQKHIDPSVAAIYVNWPNNPSGLISRPDVVDTVLELAEEHDWWIFSDDVYEDYVYEGPLRSPSQVPEISKRLIQAHSFSKAYGMAGNRVGYLIGPEQAIERITRLTTYLVYGACRAAQRAATRALLNGDSWLDQARTRYAEIGRETAQMLSIPAPQGSTFHFFDVAGDVGPDGVAALLDRCVSNGLLVAPGSIFGADYSTFLRVCYTCNPPEVIRQGVQILLSCLGRANGG